MHNLAIFIKGGQGADYFRQQVGEAGILEMVDELNDTLITGLDMTPEQLTRLYEMINRIEWSLDKTVNDPRTRKAMNVFDFASTAEKPGKNLEEKPGKNLKEKPVETKEETTEEKLEEKPVETKEEKPVETKEETTEEKLEEKPVETKEEKPVEATVETKEETTVETKEETTVETKEETTVETKEETTVETKEETTEEKPAETPAEVEGVPATKKGGGRKKTETAE